MLYLMFLLAMLSGCSTEKSYLDVIRLNQAYIKLINTYIGDLEKADDAESVAEAMNRFADRLEPLWKDMEKMTEKYPELKEMETPPEPLRESFEQAEEMGRKMSGTIVKIMPYIEDLEVRKAHQRLMSIMNL